MICLFQWQITMAGQNTKELVVFYLSVVPVLSHACLCDIVLHFASRLLIGPMVGFSNLHISPWLPLLRRCIFSDRWLINLMFFLGVNDLGWVVQSRIELTQDQQN